MSHVIQFLKNQVWFLLVIAFLALAAVLLPALYGNEVSSTYALTFGVTTTIANAPNATSAKALHVNETYYLAFTSNTANSPYVYIYITTSSDGNAWSDPVQLEQQINTDSSGDVADFELTYSSRGGFLAMTYLATGTQAMFATSSHGNQWSTSSLYNAFGYCNTNNYEIAIAFSTSSDFAAAACGFTQPGYEGFYIVTSSNAGSSWGATSTIEAAGWGVNFREIVLNIHGGAGSEIIQSMYVITRDGVANPIRYASSTDYGTTFSTSTVDDPTLSVFGSTNEGYAYAFADDGTPSVHYRDTIDSFSSPIYSATQTIIYGIRNANGSWSTSSIAVLEGFSVDGSGGLPMARSRNPMVLFDDNYPILLASDDIGGNYFDHIVAINTSSFKTTFLGRPVSTADVSNILGMREMVYNSDEGELAIFYSHDGAIRFVTSSLQSVSLRPTALSTTTVSNISTSSFTIGWTTSTNDMDYAIVRVYEVASNSTSTPGLVSTVTTDEGVTSTTITGLTPGALHVAEVIPVNVHGNGLLSLTEDAYTLAVAAPTPVITASSTSSTVLGVTNTFGENSSSSVFAIYNETDSAYMISLAYADSLGYSTTTNAIYSTLSVWGGSPSYIGGLTANTSYTITLVQASGDEGSYTAAASSTSASGYTAAEAPGTVTAAATGQTTATVTWTSGGNPTTTEYAIIETNTGNYVNSSTLALGVATSQWTVTSTWFSSSDPLTVTGLTAGTEYCFGVAARNGDDVETTTTTASCITTTAASSGGGSSSNGGGGGSSGGGGKTAPTLKNEKGETIDPDEALLINNGAATTASQSVTLTLPETNATLMAISEKSDLSDASFTSYKKTTSFTLSSGNGVKTVYVKLKKSDGGTVTISDTIELTGQGFNQPEDDETPTNCPLPTKSAYKAASSPSVYYITSSCTKRAFVNPQKFATYFPVGNPVPPNSALPTVPSPDWSKVGVSSNLGSIPDDTLGFMPWGPYYNPQFGALVKQPMDPKVYLLLNGKKNWITDATVFEALNYQWSWIEDVDADLLPHFTTGEEIDYTDHHPDYSVIKYITGPEVYQLQEQKKRWVPTPEAFNTLHFRWDRIITVPSTETYPDGANL